MKKQYISYDKYYKISKILICIMIIIYLAPKLFIIAGLKIDILSNKLIPILWCIIIFVMIKFIPKVHPFGKIMHTQNICFEAIICASILIGVQIMAGIIIDSIGKSPYNHSILGILSNFINVFPALIARELIRAYLLNTYCKTKNSNKAFVIITAFIIILDLKTINIVSLLNVKSLVIYIAENLGPTVSINALLSFFALYGGSKTAIIYVLIISGFHWFSPILPDLKWITAGAIGIIVPAFEIMIVFYKYKIKTFHIKYSNKIDKLSIGDMMLFVISIALIWFVLGVFPVYPSVIATGSMIPLIQPGDVILIKRPNVESDIFGLKIGDIITFDRDNITITHRIIEIVKNEAGNISFKTKGDNNSAEDYNLVQPNDIQGTLIKVIPKIGYPTLWFKARQEPIDGIEF